MGNTKRIKELGRTKMNTNPIERSIKKMVSLCKRYINYLSKIRDEIQEISHALENRDLISDDKFKVLQAKFQALQFGFYRFQPALVKLIRTISQTLEHSIQDQIDGLELAVLLAELEADLEHTQFLLNNIAPLAMK
jgi:hypothetical protein